MPLKKTWPEVELYCDGSCLKNPGPGGYAYLLRTYTSKGPVERISSGSEPHTTNNRMELMAAIEGLKALKKPCRVKLYSDSNYVVKGMKEWIFSWVKNNWKNSQNKPVTNQDLWQNLYDLDRIHEVHYYWVKGHAGHKENEQVDALARQAAERV